MTRSTPPRARGRPGAADDADRRARILDVAIELFSRHGIAATSMSQITRAAHVAPALLHYYFGDRDRLVDTLVEERIAPAIGAIGAAVAAAPDAPRDIVRVFVRAMSEGVTAHPWFPPLWLREVLSEGGLLRDRLVGTFATPVARGLRDRFARAQAEGVIDARLDPRLLVVSLISLTLFPHAAAPVWRPLLEAGDVTSTMLAEHTIALLERALEPPR